MTTASGDLDTCLTRQSSDDPLRTIIYDLIGGAGVEAACIDMVDTSALAIAGKGPEAIAIFIDLFRKEALADFSKEGAFQGKKIAPLIDALAERLAQRIAALEATGAGSA